MAEWRRIKEAERLKVLRNPDHVEEDGEYRIHYDHTTRDRVMIICVIAVGTGTAILSQNPIFGLSAGTFCSIVSWMLKRKK